MYERNTVSLSTKLTLCLGAMALALFGTLGLWHVRVEERDLRAAAERDMRLLGRTLQIAFENALRDRQGEDVGETLRELERIAPEVDIYVYDAEGLLVAVSSGASAARFTDAASMRPGLRFDPPTDSRRIELVVPLEVAPGAATSTLVIERPLDEMRRDLDATRARVAYAVLAFVVLLAALTMALGRYWVGRPLARMIEQMRRVRAGDLSPSPSPPRTDEVTKTLAEFELLVRELRVARENLGLEIERSRQLERRLRELDKLATVGELAAGLAHEIGSPLQILAGRIASLERRAHDPHETRRIAAICLEQTQRITRIVSNLLGVARRRTPRVREMDVRPSIRAVVELLEGEARRNGVTIELVADPDLPSIAADPDQVQQIALNLLRNALAATSRGGRIVVAARKSPRAGSREPYVRLSVSDDGVGMEPEVAERCLTPFFSTRAAEGGTGLGLAVVKGIVDEHGGAIEVASEPGAGTTVIVDLPVSEALPVARSEVA